MVLLQGGLRFGIWCDPVALRDLELRVSVRLVLPTWRELSVDESETNRAEGLVAVAWSIL